MNETPTIRESLARLVRLMEGRRKGLQEWRRRQWRATLQPNSRLSADEVIRALFAADADIRAWLNADAQQHLRRWYAFEDPERAHPHYIWGEVCETVEARPLTRAGRQARKKQTRHQTAVRDIRKEVA